MEQALGNDLVSIIIPVYNVRDYLDVCLESIVNQTYKNIEILLINDGSTDGSEEKCLDWEKKDKRIIYISKKNEGLGPTRNYGIEIAHGEYVAFVDSDDWLDITFIEKMYNKIVENNADIAECDFYRIAVDSGIKSYNVNNGVMEQEFTKTERIIWGSVLMWKMLIKKELWTKNNIKMPALPAEDLAVYALLIALSEEVCSINEPLYCYRKNRPGSITFTKESFKKIPLAMRYLIDNFKTRNIFEKYRSTLYRQMLRWTSRCLVASLTKTNKLEYKEFEKIYIDFLEKNFSYEIENIIVFGSYNLTRIANKLIMLENPYNRFQFMSLVSVMSANNKLLEKPNHKNPYRKYMLDRQFDREFFSIVDEINADYIIIDFIEERHDLIKSNSVYITKSDALMESDFKEQGEILARDSAKCQEVWEQACLLFIVELKKRFKADHVILVENYLAEEFGDINNQVEYENISEIRASNSILESYYDFFTRNYPGIQKIKLCNNPLYFTDIKYEYGCYPWHLNDLLNREIAKKIKV